MRKNIAQLGYFRGKENKGKKGMPLVKINDKWTRILGAEQSTELKDLYIMSNFFPLFCKLKCFFFSLLYYSITLLRKLFNTTQSRGNNSSFSFSLIIFFLLLLPISVRNASGNSISSKFEIYLERPTFLKVISRCENKKYILSVKIYRGITNINTARN